MIIEIPDEQIEKIIGKFVQENIESVVYKLDMKEIEKLIREECRPIIEQEFKKLRGKKWYKK